jgi:hypothetical protein
LRNAESNAFAFGLSESVAVGFAFDYSRAFAVRDATTISDSATVGVSTTGNARI